MILKKKNAKKGVTHQKSIKVSKKPLTAKKNAHATVQSKKHAAKTVTRTPTKKTGFFNKILTAEGWKRMMHRAKS